MVDKKDIIEIIIGCLSDDLLKPKYLKLKSRNKYVGHCYVATEALYHLMDDEDKKVFKPAILKVNGDTHWFLKHKITGEIIDITKDQFDFDLDYSTARNTSFLTKKPSKRTLILIVKMYGKIGM